MSQNYFQELYDIDIADRIKKKNNLDYLPWSSAWAFVKAKHPDATYTTYYNENGRQDSFDLANYTVLYNGKYVSSVAGLDTSFRNGQIEFIDSPNSKVAKITSYEVFVVNNFDKTNEKIYFR